MPLLRLWWLAAAAYAPASALLLAQAPPPPPRLAIVPAESAFAAAGDVLTATLSKSPDVTLLERAQIDKVLREQELSAANQDYLKLGRILGADGLMILEGVREQGTNRCLQARLLAVRPGVVLTELRSPWPLQDVVAWSSVTANEISPLLSKLAVLPKDAVPISVLNLRSPLRTVESQDFERELTLALIHRLTHERDLFVLERQHLDQAAAEKQFANDESPFWTGRYLLDGAIDPDSFNPTNAVVRARLTPPQGGAVMPIEASGPRDNLAAVADSLAVKVMAALHRAPSGAAWNPDKEASEYLDQSHWAAQWGLFPEAAAAAESAWALGRHDPAVAEARIKAYCGCTLPGPVPDPALFPPLSQTTDVEPPIRAGEAFCAGWRREFTHGAPLDTNWYDLGLKVLRAGAHVLACYNDRPEYRPPQQAALERLQPLMREVAAILETNDARPDAAMKVESIGGVEAETACYWFDRPEDVLPLWDRLLARGFHPFGFPKMAAWSQTDRQRIPLIVQGWLEKLRQSSDLSIRLEGLMLSIMNAPDDGGGLRERLEKQLSDALWENRRWVLANESNFWCLDQIRDHAHYYAGPPDKKMDSESFVDIRQRLRLDYLSEKSTADRSLFAALFESVSYGVKDASAANAAALLPLMEGFRPPWLDLARRERALTRLRETAGAASAPSKLPPPKLPPERTLTAAYVAWPPLIAGAEAGWIHRVMYGVAHGHWIYYEVRSGRSDLPGTGEYRYDFVGFDLANGQAKVVPFDIADRGANPKAFDFSTNALFVIVESWGSVPNPGAADIYRRGFDQSAWSPIPVQISQAKTLVAVGGRVYVSTTENLLELDPEKGEFKIVASARRHPAQNVMDTNWSWAVNTFVTGDGRLGAYFGETRWLDYNPISETWEHSSEFPLPGTSGRMGVFERRLTTGPDGTVAAYLAPRGHAQRVLAFWNDAPAPENLLANTNLESPETYTNGPDRMMRMTPKWDWPAPYDLGTSSFREVDKSLWVLVPDKFRTSPGLTGLYWYTDFSDNRQATLFHFVPGSPDPVAVPLEFTGPAQLGTILNPTPGAVQDLISRKIIGQEAVTFTWFAAPEGMVFGTGLDLGCWYLPRSVLDANMHAVTRYSGSDTPSVSRRNAAAVHP